MHILVIASIIGLAVIASILWLPVWVARGERDVNGQPEHDSQTRPNKPTMKTQLIITLETEGISQSELKNNLDQCVSYLAGNGMFSGDSDGEVVSWSHVIRSGVIIEDLPRYGPGTVNPANSTPAAILSSKSIKPADDYRSIAKAKSMRDALEQCRDALRQLSEHPTFADDAPEFNKDGIGYEALVAAREALQ